MTSAVQAASDDQYQRQQEQLLGALKARLPELRGLLADASSHWGYEDRVYRFYHQSFKVYQVQDATTKIVEALQSVAPQLPLNKDFMQIVAEGTGKQFEMSHNEDWLHHARPMVEAFFHARHMLEMACKYAEQLTEPPQSLPSGWATILYLYGLR